MQKALIYCRVSTEEQAQDGRHSLKTQQTLCEKAIAESNRFELADNGIYIDAGKSATNMNRAGLQDMLIRVQEEKDIAAVYVLDTDRLARNAQNHFAIRAILQKHRVELISISQPGIQDSPEGNLLDIVMAGVNQFQSQLTGRKTLKSMEQKFNGGWWIGRAPIGYLNAGEPSNLDKKIITVDPIKGSLVSELFKLYSTGSYSLLDLRDEMFKKGLTSLSSGKLGLGHVSKILKSPFYYGEMQWRGLTNIGKHPPLVSKEIFERCQMVLDNHNHSACRGRKYNFLLRGFIYSSVSGLRFIGEHHPNKSKTYYRPYLKSSQKPGTIPEEDQGINADYLEELVEERFRGIQFSDAFVERLMERVRFIYNLKKHDVERKKKELAGVKSSAETKLAVAEEKLLSGTLDDTDFTRIKTKQREIINSSDEEIAKLDKSKNIKVDIIQKVILLARNIGEAYQQASPELKRVYLSLFWDKFEVANKKLTNAIPSPIIEALIATGSICFNKKQKPFPMEKAFAEKNSAFRDATRIRKLGGP